MACERACFVAVQVGAGWHSPSAEPAYCTGMLKKVRLITRVCFCVDTLGQLTWACAVCLQRCEKPA